MSLEQNDTPETTPTLLSSFTRGWNALAEGWRDFTRPVSADFTGAPDPHHAAREADQEEPAETFEATEFYRWAYL